MEFEVAMILAIFIPAIGILMLAAYKLNICRKIPLNICRILCVLSICIYISFYLHLLNIIIQEFITRNIQLIKLH